MLNDTTWPVTPTGLDWSFVEQHYPDYSHSDMICRVSDMGACFEFIDLDKDALITADTVGRLKLSAPDRINSREPSYQQVHAFDDYIGSGKTFGQAASELEQYCYARAVRHHSTDKDLLPERYVRWAENILD